MRRPTKLCPTQQRHSGLRCINNRLKLLEQQQHLEQQHLEQVQSWEQQHLELSGTLVKGVSKMQIHGLQWSNSMHGSNLDRPLESRLGRFSQQQARERLLEVIIGRLSILGISIRYR